MMLSEEELLEVVERAPLASIDLVVQNRRGQILFGLRKNEPAKGYWFVPGGRIRKDEPLSNAFHRICKEELNLEYESRDASFLGVFEHFYPTNFAGKGEFGTHYVVLAYQLVLQTEPENLPTVQHSKYQWMGEETISDDLEIHPNAKDYFRRVKPVDESVDPVDESVDLENFLATQGYKNKKQYELVAARRDSHNTLLWQTPVLSLTAQAFLLTIALGSGTSPWARIMSAILALCAALASVHLLARHRSFEVAGSEWLQEFEAKNRHKGYDPINTQIDRYKKGSFLSRLLKKGSFLSRLWPESSYLMWKRTLLSFAGFSAAIIIIVVMQWLELLPADLFGAVC